MRVVTGHEGETVTYATREGPAGWKRQIIWDSRISVSRTFFRNELTRLGEPKNNVIQIVGGYIRLMKVD